MQVRNLPVRMDVERLTFICNIGIGKRLMEDVYIGNCKNSHDLINR